MMKRDIIGVYSSIDETIEAIRDLTAKGYDSKDLAVISKRQDIYTLDAYTNADVEKTAGSAPEEHDDESFWDKLKEAFSLDGDFGESHERLTKYGIAEENVESYAADMDNDKILLAVNADSAFANAETGADEWYGAGRIESEEEAEGTAGSPSFSGEQTVYTTDEQNNLRRGSR
ncbi:general stress protein [Bacillus infantis]|uniref:general stress protein n=1 Tax=Bacillus infantis TaxID=324767 RepID=UPI003CF9E9FE